MRVAALLLASALAFSACGDSATAGAGEQPLIPATVESPTTVAASTTSALGYTTSTASLMAAAFEQLVTKDHTFGKGPPPFTEYLVLDHLDPQAGSPEEQHSLSVRSLTESEREAITAVLSGFGPVKWIDDAAKWRTDQLAPVIEGSVILGVGEPIFSGETALVPMSLWCGGLCALLLTYGAVRSGDTWMITGTRGSRVIA